MDGRRLGQLAEDPFGGKPARTQTAAGEEEFNEEQTTNSDQLAPRLLGGAPRRSPVHESRSGARNEFGYAQSSHDPSEKRASPQLDEIPQPDEAIRVDEETRSPAKKKARVGEGIDEGASTSAGQTPSKSRAPNQNQDENPRRTHRTSFIKGNFLISRTPLTTNSDQLAPRLLGGAPRRSPVHESRSGARNEFGYAQSSHDPSEKRASPQLDEIPQPDEAIRVDEERRRQQEEWIRMANEQILRNEEILASGDTAASAEASLKSFWLLVHFLMIF